MSKAMKPFAGVWRACWRCSWSQRCSTLGFMPCLEAMVLTDAPGSWQAATKSDLNCAL
jgi:hypothetical protein